MRMLPGLEYLHAGIRPTATLLALTLLTSLPLPCFAMERINGSERIPLLLSDHRGLYPAVRADAPFTPGSGKSDRVRMRVSQQEIIPVKLLVRVGQDDMRASGYVQDAETLAAMDRIGVPVNRNSVRLAYEAPAGFDRAVIFGLKAAQLLRPGAHVEVNSRAVLINGEARSPADFNALAELADEHAPTGFAVDRSNVRMAIVTPYRWSLEKDTLGRVRLNGYAPSRELMTNVLGTVVSADKLNRTLPARGEPAFFENLVLASAAAANHIASGGIFFHDTRLEIALRSENQTLQNEILNEYSRSGIDPTALSIQFTRLPPSAKDQPALDTHGNDLSSHVDSYLKSKQIAQDKSEANETVQPYHWTAEKSLDGLISLSGFVPDMQVRDSHGQRARVNRLMVGTGAPSHFVRRAELAFDIMTLMDVGQVSLTGDVWKVTGQTDSTQKIAKIARILGNDNDVFKTDIDVVRPIGKLAFSVSWKDGKLSPAGYLAEEESWSQPADDQLILAELRRAEREHFYERIAVGLKALKLLKQGHMRFDGVTGAWHISGLADREQINADIRSVLSGPNDWDISISIAETGSKPVAGGETHTFHWRAEKNATSLLVNGDVPDQTAKSSLQGSVGKQNIGRLDINANAPEQFLQNANAALSALKDIESGAAQFRDGEWRFSGRVSDFGTLDRINRILAMTKTPWQTDLGTPSRNELCSNSMENAVSVRPVRFRSGSARLSEKSQDVIAEIARYLRRCPDAVIEVEGHTDADGATDENLALSVLRAEQVVERLVALDVDPRRLFAVGYGESLPVATNQTKWGKQQNRRIVFTVRERAE